MRRAEDYRGHARDCRDLARGLQEPYRKQLLDMADDWERLARERERRLAEVAGDNDP